MIEQNIMATEVDEEVKRTTERWQALQHQVSLHRKPNVEGYSLNRVFFV